MGLVLVGMLVSLGACDGPRAIPRIEPTLHGWDSDYRGVSGIEVHVFNTGLLRIPAVMIHRGSSFFETREVVVPAFVIRHPGEGLIVFDTGLSADLAGDEDADPQAGLVHTARGQDLPTQMVAAGLSPTDVRYVVVSHLHWDHTGALDAFPDAQVWVAARELAGARQSSWWSGSFFHSDDFENVSNLHQVSYAATEPLATFDGHVDLLGDGSVRLVDLSGHTAGSQGMLIAAQPAPILLTGDASYVEESWRYGARPLLAHDMDAWWLVSWKIKKFTQLVPSLVVLPGHDLRPVKRFEDGPVVYHEFAVDKDEVIDED